MSNDDVIFSQTTKEFIKQDLISFSPFFLSDTRSPNLKTAVNSAWQRKGDVD